MLYTLSTPHDTLALQLQQGRKHDAMQGMLSPVTPSAHHHVIRPYGM